MLLLLTATLLGALQIAATAAISPLSCGIETTHPVTTGDGGDQQALLSGVEIGFTNHSSLPIVDATFAVTYGGQTTTIKDVGTFAPGVTIHHRFALPAQALVNEEPACRVVSAHYSALAQVR